MATEVTPEKTERFLKELRKVPSVARAARLAGFARQTAYKLQKADAEFADAWKDALDEGVEALEEEAMKRAKHSDTLLIFLLKAHRPELYRDRQEVGAIGGGPVTLKVVYEQPNSNRSPEDAPPETA